MHSLLPPPNRWPLHGIAATRRVEADAAAKLPFNALMKRAGLSIARFGRAIAPHAHRAWVVAGPGNNGGDGIEAARLLHESGLEVHLTLVADAAHLPHDASAALKRAQAAGLRIHSFPHAVPSLGPQDLAIDALLGIGSSRKAEGAIAALISQLNALPCALLAVDVPSGLNANTGQSFPNVCVRATHTLTLLTAKPGLFTAMGRDAAGHVWIDTLGIELQNEPAHAWLIANPQPRKNSHPHASHKGSFGDVAVVGGAHGMAGAALLAARSAHAAGAGRVYFFLWHDPPARRHNPQRPELMMRTAWWQSDASVLSRSTVVCGCGAADAVRHVLPRLLHHVPRLVLDADALNAIAKDQALQRLLMGRAARDMATVITPHPLEAARLLGQDSVSVQSDRLAAAKALAERFSCVVVLKGSGSIVSAPGHACSINPTGNAALATAGTGDVLAGWIGGSWSAQDTASDLNSALQTTLAAVWLHGLAADQTTAWPLRATELIEAMHMSSGKP
jgi:hydroxyethylthiazole kinase-like uncharacterized protein yjeF